MTEYVLGFDSFSILRICVEKETGTRRAAKIIMRSSLRPEAQFTESKVEKGASIHDAITIMMRLDHPNINHLRDYYETDNAIILLMDFYLGGELLDDTLTNATYKECEIQCIMTQLLSGVQSLHSQWYRTHELETR